MMLFLTDSFGILAEGKAILRSLLYVSQSVRGTRCRLVAQDRRFRASKPFHVTYILQLNHH